MAGAFIFGFLLGFASVHWPWILKDQWDSVLTLDEFKELHPEKRWIRYIMTSGLFFAVILFLIMLPVMPHLLHNANGNAAFFVSFWFIGTVSFLDSLIELCTGLSPLRIVNAGRGGGSGVMYIVLDKRVRLFGIVHLAIVLIVGVLVPMVFG